ncbi:hypothetical protein A2159_01085 [Candidatus Woesebacteria bacterium RBG_13_34_9]|uniref:Urease accessory protein UreH-like transmembrane domain-containing protein n=1 Tax=Candidatus Woesebacteria bacterium RBG_13_34_9 TaxID=1802477 RepID=A0A1F7X7G0_9BACT|nr:MAG: hypothetical protein A2159_01085 [Candidatus Woesebacteria bacterium RBG_13_34_9]
MNQVLLAFVTGLTTGGISCFAVQGGLLASSLAQQKSVSHKFSIIVFLITKILAYTVFGAVLGLLGASLIISPKIQGYMQIFAGLFMLLSVAKLLDLHPIFRRFVITPPKVIFKLLRKTSLKDDVFTPAILGFLTVLIPCGITQSMMLLSIASSNFLQGALILGSFTLGTAPVFFGLGIASTQILKRRSLRFVASTAILILALISLNTGQILRGSPHTFQNYWLALGGGLDKQNTSSKTAEVGSNGSQEVEINVSNYGYQTNIQTLKVGIPVNLKLITNNTRGCSRAFTIPQYNISKVLPETGTTTIEFTPTRKGRLTYTCSMGMYTGYFEVI